MATAVNTKSSDVRAVAFGRDGGEGPLFKRIKGLGDGAFEVPENHFQ
jgi:hypothetical protein